MTLIIGLRNSARLIPIGMDCVIEPGVVIVGDSRYTFGNALRPKDFGAKIDTIGKWGIAGFAGSIKLAKSVLADLDDYCATPGNRSAPRVAQQALKLLTTAMDEVGDDSDAHLLLGLPHGSEFDLYRITNRPGPSLTIQEYFDAVGQDISSLRPRLLSVINEFDWGWESGAVLPFKKSIAEVAWRLMEDQLTLGEARQLLSADPEKIGGFPQLAVVDKEGPKVRNPGFHDILSITGEPYLNLQLNLAILGYRAG